MRWSRLKRLHWSTLREIQEFRLRQFVTKQVYPFSAHYRALFDAQKIDPHSIRTLYDLRRLPLTTKADLLPTEDNRTKFRDFVLAPTAELIRAHWPLSRKLGLLFRRLLEGRAGVMRRLTDEYKPIFFTATTGRSSESVMFLYSAHDIANLRHSGRRLLDTFQADPEWRGFNIFPFAPHLAFWQAYYGGVAARMLMTSTGGGKVMGTAGNLGLIERLKAEFLIGVPSYVYHLLRTAAAEGRDLSHVRTITLGAEKVPLGLKAKMVEMLTACGADAEQVRIFGTYGFTEAKCAWGECPTALDVSSGYHLFPDREIFEVIDPDSGEVVDEGEDGELVYTPLDARGSVVMRYRTGDLVKGGIVYTEPCPHCGKTVPRINSSISRVSNQTDLKLTKVKGTLVSLDELAAVLLGAPEIDEWLLEITKKDDDPFGLDVLTLIVAPRQGHKGNAALTKTLRERLVTATEVAPNEIRYVGLDELNELTGLESSLKEVRILDKRPKP